MENGGQNAGGPPQHKPSGRSEGGADGPSQSAAPKTAEELIRDCRDDPGPAPFYVACFNGRPLQVIPPGGAGAHLTFFMDLKIAHLFMSQRAMKYPDESVGLSPVNSIADILHLANANSTDPDYVRPPCGLVIDFSYALPTSALTIAPAEMSNMNSGKLARLISHWADHP